MLSTEAGDERVLGHVTRVPSPVRIIHENGSACVENLPVRAYNHASQGGEGKSKK